MMEKKLHSFICTEDNVRIGGRTMLENDIRYMDYTCTYVEFTFTGTYAEAEIISDLTPSEDIFRAWAVVCVNGSAQPAKRFKLDSKRAAYELYSSDKEETVTIRLMKVSEAAFSKMGVAEIRIDGELLPPPKPRYQRRIEFVGDSITCGYGIDGVWNKDVFSTETENPIKGYAYKTAQLCKSEFQYVSWSGMGVLSSWVDEKAEKPLDNWLITDIYPYTDSGLENTLGREGHENHTKWDFSKYVPQVIVFNMGTNDQSWTKKIPERVEQFGEKYYAFIKMLREHNPNAYIVCAYGVMDDPLADTEEAQIERFKSELDDNIEFVRLPVQQEADGIGADWHPSENTHTKMAMLLSEKINGIFEKMGM